MKYNRGTNRILLSFFIISLAATSTVAMDDGGGRSVFATGAGNRALSLGGAYTAIADDASAPVWNPGGLGLIGRKELQATQTTLFGMGFSEQYASFVLPSWRWGAASLTWRRFGVDGIEERDERGFLLDDNLEDVESELALGYGYLLANGNLSLGGTLKVQTHKLAGYSGSGLGADLGAWSRPLALAGMTGKATRLRLGLAVRNAIEPSIKLDQDAVPDPTTLRAGLAWQQPVANGVDLLLATDVERSRDMSAQMHAGVECRLQDMLALRVGTSDGTFTAGAGLDYRSLGADYQYEGNELGDIHRFGLAVSFGPTTAESHFAYQAAADAELQQQLDAVFDDRNRQYVTDLAGAVEQALEQQLWNDALDRIGSLAVLDPERGDLAQLEATALVGLAGDQERQGDMTAAILNYRRALSLVPDDARASTGLARVRAESDRRSERGREIKARLDAALDAFARDELLTARDGFATVVELAPGDRDAATMLARTERAIARRAAALAEEAVNLAQADQPGDARQRLDAARNLDPNEPMLATAEAEVRRAEQRLAARRQAAATAAAGVAPATTTPTVAPDLRPTISEARRREIDDLYRRGLAAMEAGRRDEAVRYWEIVWTADAGHQQVREYLGQEYLAQGMEAYAGGALQRAVTSWEQALRVDPADARARGYLDRAHQQLARMEKISGSR